MVPTITTLLKLADAFDRPVGYFVDEEADGARPVPFTPAPARGAAYSPHAGVTSQSISGSYARFFLDGAVTTEEPGAGGGAGLSQNQGEELLFMAGGDAGLRGRRPRLPAPPRRCPALPHGPASPMGESRDHGGASHLDPLASSVTVTSPKRAAS